MSTRINPFATLADAPAFTTKPKPENPAEKEIAGRIADENGFLSRQAPKPPKEPRRKRRVHRTGRNRQFNLKATSETVERFYKLADERKVVHGLLLEMALDALERAG